MAGAFELRASVRPALDMLTGLEALPLALLGWSPREDGARCSAGLRVVVRLIMRTQ